MKELAACPTPEQVKERRKAELEAAEEFAFAGRSAGRPSRLRTAGYSCAEAKAAGYSYAEARAAGYTLAEAAEAAARAKTFREQRRMGTRAGAPVEPGEAARPKPGGKGKEPLVLS